MPLTRVNDLNVYYEEHGPSDGDPVLLIAGLSLNTTTWFRQIPARAARYRVVAFDNRGARRSDKRHYFHIERADEVNTELLSFLDRMATERVRN